MATTTTRPQTFVPDDPQVYHPLVRLRGVIRRYVVIEGLLSAVIFLSAWFALALVLDFGVFKAFTWDWVLDGAWYIRLAVLVLAGGMLAAILAFRIGKRLATELSYPALALVLERRFPRVLGDRLITAVELADVKEAARYGYSAEMIRQTIGEARERVGTVPVREAFNWARLYWLAGIAAGILVAVVVGAYASHAIAMRAFSPGAATWKFYHVASILAERDLFLQNTPWPRRALLELDPEIKEAGIRVARDGPPPKVRVKAYRWVIADRAVRDGWRPLRWSDVTPGLVGGNVPDLPLSALRLPDEKVALPATADGWTLDAVWERARDNAVVRDRLSTAMGAEPYQSLQGVLDQLEKLAEDPARERTLRRLDKPQAVTFDYAGAKTGGGGTLNPEGTSEYAGEIGGLKEDVSFVIKAEDYRTPPRTVTLIPPPTLVEFKRQEFHPAYLYYPPPLVPNPDRPGEMMQLGPSSLKGRLQTMVEEKLSLTGDRTTFVVPAGAEVVITGVTELPIARAFVLPRVGRVPGAKPGSASLVPLPLSDEKTFSIAFRGDNRLTSAVEFDLLFENEDKVQSSRKVLIQVAEDQAPVVEVIPEFIRRVGTYYYVTPRAKLPFNPESMVTDDNGLSKVEYTASWVTEDTPLGRAMRMALITRMLIPPLLPGEAGTAAIQSAYHAATYRSHDKVEERRNGTYELASFLSLVNRVKPETQVTLDRLLSEPKKLEKADLVRRLGFTSNLRSEITRLPSGALEAFRWRVEGDYFDVAKLNLEVIRGDIQPRYLIQLSVRATDTNCDTGPKVTSNADPIRVLVVSPADLLYEIGKDEEALAAKLDEAIKKLDGAKRKYEYVRSKNGFAPPEDMDSVRVRSKDVIQDLAKAREILQTLLREFRRIEKECIYNQLDEKTVANYGKVANWCDRLLGESPQPVSPAEEEFFTKTPVAFTFPIVEKLTGLVQNALDENRWAEGVLVSDAEISISGLHRELGRLRTSLGEGETFDKVKNEFIVIRDAQRRVRDELKAWQRSDEEDRLKDFPAISAPAAVFLRKGETKRIQHAIKWRQYKEDSFVVKVASSDKSAVVAPDELKLDFEKNELSFDYEIRAANKEGEFTVTLIPALGPKIEYKVSVK